MHHGRLYVQNLLQALQQSQKYLLFYPHFMDENTETEQLRNLLQVPQ